MNKSLCCAVLALAFSVAGCAGSAYETSKKHEALRDYQGTDAGVVIASAGAYKGSGFTSSSVTFRRRNTEDLLSIYYSPRKSGYPGGTVPDFDSTLASGTVIVHRLPPGEYEMLQTEGVELHSGTGYRCKKPLPPVVAFTVHPGEVIYLGRYLTVSSKKNCVNLHISDEQQSDLTVARARAPIPDSEVHSYVPAVEQRRQ